MIEQDTIKAHTCYSKNWKKNTHVSEGTKEVVGSFAVPALQGLHILLFLNIGAIEPNPR